MMRRRILSGVQSMSKVFHKFRTPLGLKAEILTGRVEVSSVSSGVS